MKKETMSGVYGF